MDTPRADSRPDADAADSLEADDLLMFGPDSHLSTVYLTTRRS